MKILELTNVRINNHKRLNSSINGNPRYSVSFDNGITGKTPSDASLGYSLTNYIGKNIDVIYHVTKVGNIIIDDITEINGGN